ncbi:MAG: CocE/NonD family hydrolase [Planctomycetota bacterium]
MNRLRLCAARRIAAIGVLGTFFMSAVDQTVCSAAEGVSPGTYEVVVERDVMVPMRDGVKLAADLHFPAEGGKRLPDKLPVVLMRTPYGKSSWGRDIVRFFAEHGYLSVVQDCRGRGNSEGTFYPFRDDPNDGCDTIAWLARHPASNGKVGMHGPSYMGWVQFHAATQNPPGLVTMIPHHGPTNTYHYSMRCGGALHLGLLKWVLNVTASSQEAQKDPAAAKEVRAMLPGPSFLDWCARIPWERGKTPLASFPAYEDAAFGLYFEHHDYDAFWRHPGFAMDEYFDSFPEMPVLWVTSWFDWYPRTISDGYQKMIEMGRKDQHLLIGPWTHNNFRTTVGDVNFGNAGGRIATYEDFLHLELAWFDRWMKGDENVELGPPVKFFMMGGGDGRRAANGRLNHGGTWIEGNQWPPKTATATALYLHQDGTLGRTKPTQQEASTSYTYDPSNTVSSNGRCIIAYGPAAGSGFAGMGPRDQIDLETLPGHGYQGKPIVERPDVLVYQTPPLERDVEIAGNIKIVLWVSSDAPDTDFYVKLVDVHPKSGDYPSGYGFPVSEGILRARYRDGFEKPNLMKPGEVYRIEFPLEPAANRFLTGHRIQIYLASSNFPNFDINRNTADPNDRRERIARNTVHHDADHASAIVLPVCGNGQPYQPVEKGEFDLYESNKPRSGLLLSSCNDAHNLLPWKMLRTNGLPGLIIEAPAASRESFNK